MVDLEIFITSDGSHSLLNRKLNETYHSVHGAVQESMHVFIKSGLEFFCQLHNQKHVSVLEVGFGTGLNALLTLQYAVRNHINIHYSALEPMPIPDDIWLNLNYGIREKALQHFSALHEAPWNKDIRLVPEFTLLKVQTTLQETALSQCFDVIYFDAFAPRVQPEIWTSEALNKVTSLLKEAGVFVTYSAKGQLKRDLKNLGLDVQTLEGPPGKKEMVRATRLPKS